MTDDKFLKMILKKASEKDQEAQPYKPEELNTKEIEKITEDLRKELAKKRR